MKRHASWCFTALVPVLLISACKKDGPAPNVGFSYCPEKTGSYIEYEADSFVMDEQWAPGQDTTYYFRIKEVQRSVFTDNEGRRSIRIERYKKKFNPAVPYSQQSWTFTDAWYLTRTTRGVERVEEDMRYLRLIFPVKTGADWNGNSMNVMEEWPYTYRSAHSQETINGLPFDSVATVEQINYSDLVTTKYGVEKYAAGLGLVYKKLILLGKQQSFPNQPPPYGDTVSLQSQYWYYPDKAVIYEQRILSYGTE
ncbi:MAG: hypothetical protein IT233_04710 [Bacteroidia bacterium]|nr:hypothetical protein [Bacteroidia bacterium]